MKKCILVIIFSIFTVSLYADNIFSNGDCEKIISAAKFPKNQTVARTLLSEFIPENWAAYNGDGDLKWGTADKEKNSGKYSVFLEFVNGNQQSGKARAALCFGLANGYTGTDAIACEADTAYEISWYMKGNFSRVDTKIILWKGDLGPKDRSSIKLQLRTKIQAKDNWEKYSGFFKSGPDSKTFTMEIGILDDPCELKPGDRIYIDDVYIRKAPEGITEGAVDNSIFRDPQNSLTAEELRRKGISRENSLSNKPRTFLVSYTHLKNMQKEFLSPKKEWQKKIAEKLTELGEASITNGPWSVMDKSDKVLAPSGDKHDFISYSPYHWLNEKGEVEWRDGEVNPHTKTPDHEGLYAMLSAVRTLTWAGYFLNNKKYMERGAYLLKYWFLTPETAMNPNLNYSGVLPGAKTGRAVGIHRLTKMPEIIDCIGLLQDAGIWTASDQKKMVEWLEKYLAWATESKLGHEERTAKNNHAVFYGNQMLAIALYTGNTQLASYFINNHYHEMLRQIEPDGSMPLELQRTRPFHYVLYNIDAFTWYAELAFNLQIDLYNKKDVRGAGLKNTFIWLAPFFKGEKELPADSVPKPELPKEYHIFKTARIAALRFNMYEGEKYYRKLFPETWDMEFQNVFWPPPDIH